MSKGVPLLWRWCITGRSGLSRVLTEMGLNIRIEASHHPSSSLVHPAGKLKDLSHKWRNMKTGSFCFCASNLSAERSKKVNLIAMGVFTDVDLSNPHFSLCNMTHGRSLLCFIHLSLVQNLQPHQQWPYRSVNYQGWRKFHPPPFFNTTLLHSLPSLIFSNWRFRGVWGWPLWLIEMCLKGIIILLILNAVN